MATAITVRKYTVDVSYKINRNSVRNVDRSFRDFEKKLRQLTRRLNRGITLNIDRFTVDRRKLNTVLGDALDKASMSVVFEISRFSVNRAALTRALASVARGGHGTSLAGFGGGNTIIHQKTLSGAEWDRRETEKQRLWWERRNALRADAEARALERANRPKRIGDYSYRNSTVFGAGGIAGVASRMYAPTLTLGLGGYGLAQLNQRNQQVVSAQLQTSAVVQQAGGTAAQGGQSFDYLRSEADRIGFNYLEASGDYNKLIAGLTGAGVGLGESQKVFSGFAELSRVNKLDRVTQNRLFRALSQVAGKGKLQAEELKC